MHTWTYKKSKEDKRLTYHTHARVQLYHYHADHVVLTQPTAVVCVAYCYDELMRSRRFRPSTTNTTSGAHGGIVQSRTEVDVIMTEFDKDKREEIVSLPRKMLVKYTAGNDCQHQKSSTIFNNKKYTEENSV
ncbi:hypothetical protein J6590_088944 [Homalodisca vitripennis]|nr:hypothetical protein J6590_088944 [Homalodisca vitripennis]